MPSYSSCITLELFLKEEEEQEDMTKQIFYENSFIGEN